MIFTSFIYLYFFVIVFSLYWIIRNKTAQNTLLLLSSYVFYGWVHPWFCYLIAFSTIIDYFLALGIQKYNDRKKQFLFLSILSNMLFLGFFKYFNFFTDNVIAVLNTIGLDVNPLTIKIFLPVGISFYTFQSLSYIIDVYRGNLEARKNFIDFALFVSFFPQLVAGPIERATHLLPQVEKERKFNTQIFSAAFPLLVQGYIKKLVIADNVSVFADKVYMLNNPSLLLLIAGTLAFALQIYADFSAYTDIARGSAILLGFDLMKNFNYPYLAYSPSDFWRRWHISFSSWIRDYLYISLGGSRVNSKFKYLIILIITFGLSGLWHGAAWHFIFWGLFHALILYVYYLMGMSGKWKPKTTATWFLSVIIMFCLTIFGWILFRTSNMDWLINVFSNPGALNFDQILVSVEIIGLVIFYSIPMLLFWLMDKGFPNKQWLHAITYGICLIILVIFFREKGQDFIYFQF